MSHSVVVALDERPDDRARLLQALEATQVHARLRERAVEPLDHPVARGLADTRRLDRDPQPAYRDDPRIRNVAYRAI